MKKVICVLAMMLLPLFVAADTSDDTLEFYLDKSDLVVLGTIASEVGADFSELGVPNYICEFKVSDVLKGDKDLKGQTIKVNIKCFEMDKKDKHPLIKKGSECILFLKEPKGEFSLYVTADFWFGIQYPPSP